MASTPSPMVVEIDTEAQLLCLEIVKLEESLHDPNIQRPNPADPFAVAKAAGTAIGVRVAQAKAGVALASHIARAILATPEEEDVA